MKILKKMLSLFLTAAIIVSTICVGTVSAGAAGSSDLFIQFEESGDGYYFLHLKGISIGDFASAGSSAIATNGSWGAQIALVTSDGTYRFMCLNNQYQEGTKQLYMYMNGAMQTPDGNIENVYGFAYYNISDKYSKRSDSEYWNIYFSIPEDVYKKLSKTTSAAAQLFIYMNGTTIDVVSADPARFILSETNNSEQPASTSKKNISTLTISKPSNKTYTGKNRKAAVTVKDGDKTLVKGTDYTLSYKNCKNIGTASVTITGKSNYTGTKTLTYKIVPKKTTLKVSKKSDSKAKFSWTAVDGAEKYQIYYSTNGGKSYKKLATVSGSKTNYTSSKLDFKKYNYKFKIRSYAVDDNTKYYSSYSKAVTVK